MFVNDAGLLHHVTYVYIIERKIRYSDLRVLYLSIYDCSRCVNYLLEFQCREDEISFVRENFIADVLPYFMS